VSEERDPAGSSTGETAGVDESGETAASDAPVEDVDASGTDVGEAGTDTSAGDDLTHTDEAGRVQMVDVGDKPDTARRAVARGTIHLQPSTVEAIRADEVAKGDVLATARVGAIQAVKRTWESIPMCHSIPITNVDTSFDPGAERVTLTVAVETTGKTGCEMEALQGVTTGLNVVWDMVKAAEKDDEGQYPETRISDVRVIEKTKRPL
jgi:cyclic pyranopterin phosphate synthase